MIVSGRHIYKLIVILGLMVTMQVQASTHLSADRVKAAYVYKFTQFAVWPGPSFSTDRPIKICVLGEDPISHYLEPLNSDLVAGGPIQVNAYSSLDSTIGCSIVYVSESKLPMLDEILKFYSSYPILTVSSIKNFVRKGGIIGFVQKDQRVQIEINNRGARKVNIILNAKLLEVASFVANGHKTENDSSEVVQ